MTARLDALCFDANDPIRFARFWADAPLWNVAHPTYDEIGLVPTDDTRFQILFEPVPEQKSGQNRLHLDLTTTSIDDQSETIARFGRARPHATSTSVRAQTKVMPCDSASRAAQRHSPA
jgi:hypothetical protein